MKSMLRIECIGALAAGLGLLAGNSFGNNLAFANQDFGAQDTNAHTRLVQFDVSWENSWRDSENYDCPWIFLKYSIDGGKSWQHGTLLVAGVNPSGFGQGFGTGLDIVVPSDKKGAFLRRTLVGEGTTSTTGIQFLWDYGADLGADAAGDRLAAFAIVRLMGIEMVYIPEAPFYAGDYMNYYYYYPTAMTRSPTGVQGLGTNNLQVYVTDSGVHAMNIKIYIPYYKSTAPFDDSDSTDGTGGLISYFYDSPGAPGSCPGIWFDGSLGIARTNSAYDASDFNTNWPTGLRAYYYTRYESSQAAYRDFLDCLHPTQAVARYYGSARISGARFGIKADNDLYGCDFNNNNIFNETDDGECIPATCCSANDSLAFNDWCATRWPTEFEYEKAGRGTNLPVAQERANGYGGASVYPSSYANAGTPNEAPSNNGEDEAWMCYNIRSLGGPIRSGSLATSSSSRKKAMGSYYGVMDLNGNMMEDTISISTIKGRSYTAAHGDGELSGAGYHDVTNWPGGPDIPFVDGSGWKIPLEHRSVTQRGGEWATTPGTQTGAQPVWLSSRQLGSTPYHYNWRGTDINGTWCNSHGLRGVRSAE